ncbi:MAG: GNAT family N-acetyltransferase [Hyphomicrobiales bacterium]
MTGAREAPAIAVERLTGPAIAPALDDVARLRIKVFADYPYLYDGTLAYERTYLEALARADRAVLVVARDGDRIVGASTGLPMAAEHEEFQAPWRAHGYDPARIFYFAESVLEPAYRGLGLGHAFFDEREAHARSFGAYDIACFCAVVRPDDHPLKPHGYRTLNPFWENRGYRPVPGLEARYTWRDKGEDRDTEKPLQFWMTSL